MTQRETRRAASYIAFAVIAAFSGAVAAQTTGPDKHSSNAVEMPAALQKLFHKPVALKDQNGKVILTKIGNGHPVVMDWNKDGKNDIVIGGKNCMTKAKKDTRSGVLCFVENVGSNRRPMLKWPPDRMVKQLSGDALCAYG